jgi:hypothetical protein
MLSHQSLDTSQAATQAPLSKLIVDSRASVGPAACLEYRFYLNEKPPIAQRTPGSIPSMPRIETRSRNAKNLTQNTDGKEGLLCSNELVDHSLSLAKKAVAFFRMARSIYTRRTMERS